MEHFESRTPEWTCQEVLRLIQEFGNRPALWDPDCEGYKNRYRKHESYMELASIFNCSKLEVERKMKILMQQYRRERLKALRMRKLGKQHYITWYGYRAFGFMNKQLIRFKNRRNLMNSQENVIKQEEGNDFESGALRFDEPEDEVESRLSQDKTLEAETNKEKTECSYRPESSSENDPPEPPRDGAGKCPNDNKDEWALFGELIAHTFRKLPDEKTRCIAKYKINTILYEAELSTYQ